MGYFSKYEAKEVNPGRKSVVEPYRQLNVPTEAFYQMNLQLSCYQTILVFYSSFSQYQQSQKRVLLLGQHRSSKFPCPSLCYGAESPALLSSSDTTQQTAVIAYMLLFNCHRVLCQGMLLIMGDPQISPHTVKTHLMHGST